VGWVRRGLLLMLALAACAESGGEVAGQVTAAATSPDAAVRGWLDALSHQDFSETAAVVDEHQLAFLVAAEGHAPEVVNGFLETGLPAEVRENFWRGFVEGVEGFGPHEVAALAPGRVEILEVYGERFAEVEIIGGSSRPVLVVSDQGGRWRVDLFANFGSIFARTLNTWQGELVGNPLGDQLRAELATEWPSLQVALDRVEITSTATAAELRGLVTELGLLLPD